MKNVKKSFGGCKILNLYNCKHDIIHCRGNRTNLDSPDVENRNADFQINKVSKMEYDKLVDRDRSIHFNRFSPILVLTNFVNINYYQYRFWKFNRIPIPIFVPKTGARNLIFHCDFLFTILTFF